MKTVTNPFVTTFLNTMAATVFNGYRRDLSRTERDALTGGDFGSKIREHILRDFRMMCSMCSVEEIAEVDRDLGIAAKMVSDGYDAWLENWYWFSASEEERADTTPITQEDYWRAIYEKINTSDACHGWQDAVDNFNSKRPCRPHARWRETE